jgi:membrane fusion protein, multidrug efflux system
MLASCAQEKKAPQRPAAPVTVATAIKKDVPVELNEIGSVEATSTISIKSQVNGELKEVHFEEGQFVKKGDLLFVIDPSTYEAALRVAEATLAKDAAQLDTARKDYERASELIKGGYVTQQQFDQAKNNAGALDAAVKGDQAAVKNARLNIDYCYIHSPVDGRTGSILMNRGNVIKANDDKPILVIYRVRPIYVSFSVPEKYLAGIKKLSKEKKLEVSASVPPPASGPLAGIGGEVSKGVLTFIDNSVDAATGTIMLKGTFENKDDLLWPGQFVNTVLKLYVQKGAVVVPTRAVQTGQKGQYLFVIKPDNTAEERSIVTGVSFGPETASQTVIEKGVNAGETVVTDGQLQLTTGAKVEIVGRVDATAPGKPIEPAAGVSRTAKEVRPKAGKSGY